MATLNSGNITNGNTIETNDILQLYDALTPGGGTTGAYNVTVSGSLVGNASTSTSASYALTSSFSISSSRAISSSFALTASYALTSSFSISSSRAISSSFATTASYALNASPVSSDTVKVQIAGAGQVTMYAFTGITPSFSSQTTFVSMSIDFPSLPVASGLGTDLFLTATPNSDTPNSIMLSYAPGSKVITFTTQDVGYVGEALYAGYVKQ